MQLIYFKKDIQSYCDNFLKNCGFAEDIAKKYFTTGKMDELEELLYYNWDEKELQKIIQNGTKIEVYLGEKDKIINSNKALEFFKNFAEVYYIKDKNHIL